MTDCHGMMLLVAEWSLKSLLHNATIASVLTGSLFHKFGFFMDCLPILGTIPSGKRTTQIHLMLSWDYVQLYLHTPMHLYGAVFQDRDIKFLI